HSQQQAGCRVEDEPESLSRLRAWLHLLLCAANTRVSRFFRRTRFRKQDHGENKCARVIARGTRITAVESTNPSDERRDRSVSADRAKTVHYARVPRSSRKISQPRGDYHKEPSSYTRRRSFTRTRRAQCSGGERFSNFAGFEFAASA